MKISKIDVNTAENEVIVEMDSITIETNGMRLQISENADGSLRLLTMRTRGGFGDAAVILPKSGNMFDLSVVGK